MRISQYAELELICFFINSFGFLLLMNSGYVVISSEIVTAPIIGCIGAKHVGFTLRELCSYISYGVARSNGLLE